MKGRVVPISHMFAGAGSSILYRERKKKKKKGYVWVEPHVRWSWVRGGELFGKKIYKTKYTEVEGHWRKKIKKVI